MHNTIQKRTPLLLRLHDEINPLISKLLFIANSLSAWDDMSMNIDEKSRYGLSCILDDVIEDLQKSLEQIEEGV